MKNYQLRILTILLVCLFWAGLIWLSSCRTQEVICPDQPPEVEYIYQELKLGTDSAKMINELLKENKALVLDLNILSKDLYQCKREKTSGRTKIIYRKSPVTNTNSYQTTNLQNIIDSLQNLTMNVSQVQEPCPPVVKQKERKSWLLEFVLSVILGSFILILYIRKIF